MPFDFYLTVAMPAVFVVMALFFVGVGLRGVVTRRPFLLPAAWLYALCLVSFAPALAQPFFLPPPGVGGALRLLLWLNPLMVFVFALFMWFAMRGYAAFAVTEASFRDGLFAALGTLGLPHEETLGAVRLPTAGADLQVAVQGWIGTGQLKAKRRAHSQLVASIAAGMNDYFRSTPAATNLLVCGFYIVMGTFLLAFAGVMAFGFDRLVPAPPR